MRRRAKVDSNHAEIVEALRAQGWEVISLAAIGGGVPDLLCWKAVHELSCRYAFAVPIDRCLCGGRWRLVEVKQPKGKLTRDQERMHDKLPIKVIRSVDEALQL